MKKLKASTDYGTRFILYLAMLEDGEKRTSKQASEDLNIPRDYLVQLASRMHHAGIVDAKVGVSGGYRLAKSPSEITVCELMDVREQYGMKTRKLADISNPDIARILELQKMALSCMEIFMDSITVQDILDAEGHEMAFDAIIARKMIETGSKIAESLPR